MFYDLASPWTSTALDRWFDQAQRSLAAVQRFAGADEVPLNVWSSDDAVVITAQVPGLTSEHLEVGLTGDVLSIAGSREQAATGSALRSERAAWSFRRAVQLPWKVDPEGIEARLADGVLTVACRRAEADKPRTIAVKAA